jgi:hypothetical protein
MGWSHNEITQLEELEYGLLANECGISKENVKTVY